MLEAQTTKKRFACLDGVRAMAAYLVVLHHVSFAAGTTLNSKWGVFFARMDVGVAIFFVLSGYLLFKPMVDAMFEGRPIIENRRFWNRRFWRIYPSYVFALVVMLIIGAVQVGGIVGFIVAVPLVQIYHPDHAIAGLTQAWSLATEVSFYFVLPLVARWLSVRCRDKSINRFAMKIIVVLALVYGASFVFRLAVRIWNPWYSNTIWHWLPSMMDIFALGMALAVVASWAKYNTDLRTIADFVSGKAIWFFGTAIAIFVVMCTQFNFKVGLEQDGFLRMILRQTLYGIISLLVVAPFALGLNGQTVLHRFFSLRPIAGVGLISYGVYLWHELLFAGEFSFRVMPWELFDGNFLGRLTVTTAATLLIAAANYRLLEEPIARRFSK